MEERYEATEAVWVKTILTDRYIGVLADYAMGLETVEVPSGRQEYLETIINNVMFR